MAAAVLPSSRGLATVRTSKTLLLILSLLSLVHVASSLIDQDTLQQLKRNLQTLEEEVATKKAHHMLNKDFFSELMDDLKNAMDTCRKMAIISMGDVPPVLEFIEDIKGIVESSKTFITKMHEEEAALIKDNEEKLRGMKERITSVEEHQAEL